MRFELVPSRLCDAQDVPGAKAVLIGRATLYWTAVADEAGAPRATEIYREEIDRILALLDCPGVASLDRSYLARPQRR